MNKENSPAEKHYKEALDFFNEKSYLDSFDTLAEGFIMDVNYIPLYKIAEKIFEVKLDHNGNRIKNFFCSDRYKTRNKKAYLALVEYFYSLSYYRYAVPFF